MATQQGNKFSLLAVTVSQYHTNHTAGKVNIVPVHAMWAHSRSEGISGTRFQLSSGQLHAWPLYPGKNLSTH
jgi:hypothetical protein